MVHRFVYRAIGVPFTLFALSALNAGKVFIYRYLNGHWSLHSELNSPVQEIGHGFGFAVGISDIFAAVGTTANRGTEKNEHQILI